MSAGLRRLHPCFATRVQFMTGLQTARWLREIRGLMSRMPSLSQRSASCRQRLTAAGHSHQPCITAKPDCHYLPFKPVGLDLRLVWWYWALEVFALLVCLYALIVNQFSRFRVAICVMMVYTSMGLTPWIQTTLDLSVGGSLQKRVNATCAGILMVTVFNFVITVLSGLYSDDEKSTSSSGTAATAEAKV